MYGPACSPSLTLLTGDIGVKNNKEDGENAQAHVLWLIQAFNSHAVAFLDMQSAYKLPDTRPGKGLRVRASARMKDRKMNFTSCWIDRSKMKLASRDCAIDIAYGRAKLTGFSNTLQSNPLRIPHI